MTNSIEKIVFSHLLKLKLNPKRDFDGNIHFRYYKNNFYIQFDPGDKSFIRVFFPKIYELNYISEKDAILHAAYMTTMYYKFIKVLINRGEVSVFYEFRVTSSGELERYINEAMDVLMMATEGFWRRVHFINENEMIWTTKFDTLILN